AQMQTLAAGRGWSPSSGLQIESSLIQRESERELVPMARGLGLGVLAWGPLGAGILSGKYASPAASGDARRLTDVDPAQLSIATTVADIAAELGHTPAQVALAWIRAQQTIPILGARTASQLADNLTCVEIHLPADTLERLAPATQPPPRLPPDFLASADYNPRGLATQPHLPPPRSRPRRTPRRGP